jgi:hypothetical protein
MSLAQPPVSSSTPEVDAQDVQLTDPTENALAKVLKDIGFRDPDSVEAQGEEFDFPTGQLDYSETARTKRLPRDLEVTPSYLRICYDEFTRDYVTVSVGADHTPAGYGHYVTVSNLAYPEVDNLKSNFPAASTHLGKKPPLPPFMQHLDPAFVPPPSTFKVLPPDSMHFLSNIPTNDVNIMMKVDPRKDCAEPLFASFGLYWVTDSNAVRISELFRCDLCQFDDKNRQNKFRGIYFAIDESNRMSTDRHGHTAKISIDPVTMIKACMFNIPTSGIRRQDIYLVCFVHKVLIGENHCGPYVRGSYGGMSANDPRLDDSLKRLKLYRQQLGFGALRLFDEKITSVSQEAKGVVMHMFATRNSLNDTVVGTVNCIIFAFVVCFVANSLYFCISQYVREMFSDRTSKLGLDALELDIRLSLYNLGSDHQVDTCDLAVSLF